MSGATSSSVRNAASDADRDEARRHGLTLGEYLNQAILAHEEAARVAGESPEAGAHAAPTLDAGDWSLPAGDTQRMTEALAKLAERLDAAERRHALSMTGLDRTVLGLAARVEDAEAGMRKASAKVSGAVEEMRRTGDAIAGRVEQAEVLTRETAGEIGATLREFNASRAALQERIAGADGAARRAAEEIVSTLHAQLSHRIDTAEAFSREVAAAAAEEIRATQAALTDRLEQAEASARSAAQQALQALRAEQEMLEARIAAAEAGGRAAAAEAMRELQAAQVAVESRIRDVEDGARRAATEAIADVRAAHADLAGRVESLGLAPQTGDALRDIEDAQRALALRFDHIEAIARQAADAATREVHDGQRAIEARLEQIEQATREAAANLRMGAAAAINQVRAAQLDLEKRVKLVEAGATFGAGADSDHLRSAHAALEERLDKIERGGAGGQDRAALHMLDAKITGLAATVRDSRDRTAAEIETIRSRLESGVERTVEEAVSRLSERLATVETAANDALRRLENAPGAAAESETLRALVEDRLETMAARMTEMVGGVREELASRAMGEGGHELEAALEDVNRRVAASERRQAQTIEAISIEIRRMSETLDRRLRALETRNDDSAAEAVREEVARLAAALEDRVAGLENREIAGVERVGAEMGRLAERLDERFDGIERRSADAIEHVGEQVARMAERFSHRQDQMARELSERIVESEERQSARLTDTLSTVAARLQAVEERTTAVVSPVQKAMTSFATRLQAVEDNARGAIGGFDRASDSPAPASFVDAPADTGPDVLEGTLVETVDLGDFDEIVDRIAAQVQPEAPPPVAATDEIVDLDEIAAPPPPAMSEPDPFDQFLPEPAHPAHADAPRVDAGANEIEFDWDEPSAPATAPPAEPPATPVPAPAPERQDYLSQARRAAQANAQTTRRRGDPLAPEPVRGLRGTNKIVLWSAAGALAVALAGGAWLVTVRGNAEDRAEPKADAEPAPALTPSSSLDSALPPLEPLAPVDGSLDDTSIAAAAAKAEADARARAQQPPPAPAPSRTPQGPQAGISASVIPASATTGAGRTSLSMEQAAIRGDAVAQYELGLQRLAAGQTPEGVALLRRAANQGLAMAQYRLGKLFERGEGVPPDLVQARQWTERAAAAGNRKAMHDLGVYYARGEGAPLDEATAFRWFRQAAELGVADSQFNLGVLYQQGRGANANPSEALYWFAVAARAGDNDARARAATLEAQLPPDVVQAVRARAIAFTPRPASARANGEFGQRLWATDSAQATAPPRS